MMIACVQQSDQAGTRIRPQKTINCLRRQLLPFWKETIKLTP